MAKGGKSLNAFNTNTNRSCAYCVPHQICRVAKCLSQRPRRSCRRSPRRHLVRSNEVIQICGAFYDGDTKISYNHDVSVMANQGRRVLPSSLRVDHATRHWRPQSWAATKNFPTSRPSGCGGPRTYGKQRPVKTMSAVL